MGIHWKVEVLVDRDCLVRTMHRSTDVDAMVRMDVDLPCPEDLSGYLAGACCPKAGEIFLKAKSAERLRIQSGMKSVSQWRGKCLE